MDSGTTFVYFSTEMFTAFKNEWTAFCRSSQNNCANIADFQSCYTYNNSSYSRLDDFFETFPPISFKLDATTSIIWDPSDYLYLNDESKEYCIGIQPLKDLIFGQIFIKDLDIMFDLDNKRMGFAQANCGGTSNLSSASMASASEIPKPSFTSESSQLKSERDFISLDDR